MVRVDRISVAVPFGASFPAHVSGTYLSTDSGECQACGSLRTTKEIGSVSHEECLLQWAWIVVIVVVPIRAILVVAMFLVDCEAVTWQDAENERSSSGDAD